MAGPIRISILANAAQAKREMDSVAGSANSMSSKFAKFGKVAAAGVALAGVAAVKFGSDAVKSAAELQQNLGGAEAVFGRFADTIKNKGAGAYKTLGLSQSDYLATANKMGSLFQGSGLKVKESVDLTSKAMRRAADVASVMGVDASMAMESVAGAAKGNFTMMDNLGVSMNAASIEAYALSKGMNFKWTTATQAEKTRVAMKMFFEKTGKYAGNYEKESTKTLSGAIEALKAQGQNLAANVGMKLLPVLTSLAVTVSTKVLPALSEFGAWFRDKILPTVQKVGGDLKAVLVPALQQMGTFLTGTVVPAISSFVGFLIKWQAVLLPIGAGVLAIVAALKVYGAYVKVVQAITKAWAAVQAALNAVMMMNPIGLVVLAIVGLVAAFVVAYKKSETFRAIIDKSWGAIKSATSSVWNFLKALTINVWNAIKNAVTKPAEAIKSVVTAVWNGIKSLTSSVWNGIKAVLTAVWNAIKAVITREINGAKAVISAVWNFVKNATTQTWNGIKNAVSNGINAVMNLVRGLKDRIVGFFSGAIGWLKSAGQAIVNGLAAGIDAAKQWLIGKIQALADLVPSWLKKRLGIASPSKVTKQIGKYTGEGLAHGLIGARDDVKSALSGLVDLVKKRMDDLFVSAKLTAQATRASLAEIAKESAALRENGKAREALGAALDAARTKLQEVTQASREYAASIRESIVATSEFASMKFVDEEGNNVSPTADAIIQQLRDRVAAAERFSQVVQEIANLGLNEQSVNNILKSGVESGLPIAEAVLAGGSTAITEINMLTKKLSDTGAVLGDKMSSKYYDAGIAAAGSVVRGLESQAEKLRARARKLAAEIAAELQAAFAGAEVAAKAEAAAIKAKAAEKDRPKADPKKGKDSGKNYNIKVDAPVGASGAEIGRTLVKYIEQYETSGGRHRS